MSVKHYGIYLAFPPTVDLRAHGLGRHLAMFLKGAQGLGDVHFTILCPSWSLEALHALFESEQVPISAIQIVSPRGKPYVLRLFEWLRAYRAKAKDRSWFSRWTGSAAKAFGVLSGRLAGRAVAVDNVASFSRFMLELGLWALLILPGVLLILPFAVLWLFVRAGIATLRRVARAKNTTARHLTAIYLIAIRALSAPERQSWVLHLFDAMQAHEIKRMHGLAANLSHVRAWYCPTAFWPSFHEIKAPRLMCVPDVVLSDFVVAFAQVGGDLFHQTFEALECAIRSGDHFVTYSEHIKWHTLVGQYGVEANKVIAIPHAPNTLNTLVDIREFTDPHLASRQYCKNLLRLALQKNASLKYTSTFRNEDVKFLFYASQFRPNKNLITLLRAYEYLLRNRCIGHKLVLTGKPQQLPEIARFVSERRLEKDVIFLHGLSVEQLAACYKLADLAVNPTLSEGGCPFTFTEALSVGTPVVMSDIPVAKEVLVDETLKDVMFFDPYDWKDCAARIEWALKHREDLLTIQIPVYQRLTQRTWSDVAREHIDKLEQIAKGMQQGIAV